MSVKHGIKDTTSIGTWDKGYDLRRKMSRGLETKMVAFTLLKKKKKKMVAFTFTSHLVTMKARQYQMCLPHYLRKLSPDFGEGQIPKA